MTKAQNLAICVNPQFVRVLVVCCQTYFICDREHLLIYSNTITERPDSLVSFSVRLINPVVVSPTIAAIGLSFFSYGFTQVGSCLEIGILQILLVIIFSLVSMENITSGMLVFHDCIQCIKSALGLVIVINHCLPLMSKCCSYV